MRGLQVGALLSFMEWMCRIMQQGEECSGIDAVAARHGHRMKRHLTAGMQQAAHAGRQHRPRLQAAPLHLAMSSCSLVAVGGVPLPPEWSSGSGRSLKLPCNLGPDVPRVPYPAQPPFRSASARPCSAARWPLASLPAHSQPCQPRRPPHCIVRGSFHRVCPDTWRLARVGGQLASRVAATWPQAGTRLRGSCAA